MQGLNFFMYTVNTAIHKLHQIKCTVHHINKWSHVNHPCRGAVVYNHLYIIGTICQTIYKFHRLHTLCLYITLKAVAISMAVSVVALVKMAESFMIILASTTATVRSALLM